MSSASEIITADFQRAVAFVNERAGSDLKMTDDAKMEIYALYKQATVGDATLATRPSRFNLLKRAMWDAWSAHKGTPKEGAMEEYSILVAHFDAGFEITPHAHESSAPKRRPSMVSMPPVKSSGSIDIQAEEKKDEPEYENFSKQALISEVEKLQAEVTKLKIFREYKTGLLSRCRGTMTGEEWMVRYYVVKPGFLRCYKSYEERIMRLEVPLYHGVSARIESASGASGAGKYKHIVVVDLPNSGTKRSDLSFLKLGAESLDEAKEWVEAILAASEDGGPPPKVEKAKTKKKFDPSLRDFHRKHQASYLSSDQSDRQSYRGVANLVLIVAVVTNLHTIINNVNTHGNLLAKLLEFNASLEPEDHWVVASSVLLPLFIFLAWGIEKTATLPSIPSALTRFLHFLNCTASLLVPGYACHYFQANPAICGPLVFVSTVLFLKLVSYAHTNTVLRERWLSMPPRESSAPVIPSSYPNNVTLFDICRFMSFPTLCYQTTYPRTDKIRPKWLLKRFTELFLTVVVQVILFSQFMMPVLEGIGSSADPITISKYVLDLSIPSMGCWLLMFYGLFHLWLNILAELTYFGDRQFYRAWWNATRLDEYWRNWNMPVHAWLVRHCFMPCMNAGISKGAAMFVVFFVSAVAHEWLVSVPCHTTKVWAFLGMLGQVPLIALTNFLHRMNRGSQVGNFIFWVTFCIVGQPLCILLYSMELSGSMGTK